MLDSSINKPSNNANVSKFNFSKFSVYPIRIAAIRGHLIEFYSLNRHYHIISTYTTHCAFTKPFSIFFHSHNTDTIGTFVWEYSVKKWSEATTKNVKWKIPFTLPWQSIHSDEAKNFAVYAPDFAILSTTTENGYLSPANIFPESLCCNSSNCISLILSHIDLSL